MIQIDVDIGSSSVARGVIGLVLGYVTSIVVDLAIVIEVCIIFFHLIQMLYQFNSIICNSVDHKVRCSFRKIQIIMIFPSSVHWRAHVCLINLNISILSWLGLIHTFFPVLAFLLSSFNCCRHWCAVYFGNVVVRHAIHFSWLDLFCLYDFRHISGNYQHVDVPKYMWWSQLRIALYVDGRNLK